MNKKTKNSFLIDIAVPSTHNLAKTITDKQNKFQELVNEICAMWKQNTAQVIPIVISSTGVIPKSLSQSLTRLNLHPNTYIRRQSIKKPNLCNREPASARSTLLMVALSSGDLGFILTLAASCHVN